MSPHVYDCTVCPFVAHTVVVFIRSRRRPPKKKQAGTRNIRLFYLASIFLNPSTLFPVLALFFFHLGVVPDTRVWGSQSKNKPSEIASDDRKRIKFAYFAVLAVFKHWCPKHTKHDTTKDV